MRIAQVATWVLLAVTVAGVSGCGKKDDDDEATTPSKKKSKSSSKGSFEPYAEVQDGVNVTTMVGADGIARVSLTTVDGEPVKDATGTITWKTPTGEVKVPLERDGDVLVARGPKLESDLNEVRYAVTIKGKPLTGVLHLPAGGTEGLVTEAKVSAKISISEGKKGPNGGVLQVVGDDVIEVVADKTTGQTRVYVLDPEFRVVPVGERKVTLGLVGPTSEIVVPTVGPGGAYFVTTLSAKVNPIKITVAVRVRERVHVALVGYRPGVRFVVGTAAPAVVIFVPTTWVVVAAPPAIVIETGWGHGHHWGHHGHGWGD